MPQILQKAQRLRDQLDTLMAGSSSGGGNQSFDLGSDSNEDDSDLESCIASFHQYLRSNASRIDTTDTRPGDTQGVNENHEGRPKPSNDRSRRCPSPRGDASYDPRSPRLCDISNRVGLPLTKPSSRVQSREKRVKGKSDRKPIRRQQNLRVTWVKTAEGWAIRDAYTKKKGQDGPSQASTCQARFGEDSLFEPVLFNPHIKANGQKTAFGDYRLYKRALVSTTEDITDGTTTFAAAQSLEQSPTTSSSRSVLCGAVGTLWCGWTDDDGRPCLERVIASADTIQQHLEVMHDVKNRKPGEKIRCRYEWCRSSFMRGSSLGAHVLNKHAGY
ncbi:hypothetical protein NMY22_g9271 [Coprinellus aureogranulatus]|nr:hypothetical protein NMY22_g9271 [Coprinellus aureogranulatus]